MLYLADVSTAEGILLYYDMCNFINQKLSKSVNRYYSVSDATNVIINVILGLINKNMFL